MTDQRIVITNSKLPTVLSFVLIAIVIGVVIVGYFAYKSMVDENLKLKNEIVEFKQLTESLVRSSTHWATKKDLEENLKEFLTKDDLKLLEEDLAKIGSKLTAVGMTVGIISKKVSELEESDAEGNETLPTKICEETNEPIDVHGYTKKVQIKELSDINTAPVAKVEFNASLIKPWKYEIYEKKYNLTTIVGKKESGQLTFHHQLQYSIPDKDPEKIYPVSILASEYKQIPKENSWYWFNPKLDANFFIGGRVYKIADGLGRTDSLLSIGMDIGFSLSSYGETKIDSWFRMFRFGAGYSIERQAGILSFSPITFNIGKPLPLLTNLYVSPQIGIDTAGGLIINLGIGPQF